MSFVWDRTVFLAEAVLLLSEKIFEKEKWKEVNLAAGFEVDEQSLFDTKGVARGDRLDFFFTFAVSLIVSFSSFCTRKAVSRF